MARKWTPEQQVFIMWLALPKKDRSPKTQKALAAHLEIDPDTLTNWKKLDELWDAVDNVHIDRLRNRLGDIFDAAVGHAIKGNHNSAKIIFDFVQGMYGKQQLDINISDGAAKDMTETAMAERAYELFNRMGDSPVSKEDFLSLTLPQQPGKA